MNMAKRGIFRGAGIMVAGAVLSLGGCGGLVINQQYRPQDGNAVQSPFDPASPGDEVFSRQSDAFPLATVTLPANPSQPPKVETVADFLIPPSTPPATIPAVQPLPQPTQTQIIIGSDTTTMPEGSTALPTGEEPQVAGNAAAGVAGTAGGNSAPVRVIGQGKAADVITGVFAGGAVDLRVTSSSGAGSMTLQRTGDNWPKEIHVHVLDAAGKPVANLEGFSAAELTAGGERVGLKATADEKTGVGTVSIPGFSRSERIEVEWGK